MDTFALIIPAAGSGERLNSTVPKPFISVAGRTFLEHTIRQFLPVDGLRQVIVSTSGKYVDEARQILAELLPDTIEGSCVLGGDERQDSIFNALRETADVDLVAVHDAVRPFIRPQIIRKCLREAALAGGAIVGVPAKDTIKKLDGDQQIIDTPDRQYLWQAQTPQIFKRQILLRAYEKAAEDEFLGTDDASLVERLGESVKMVEGNRDNFKVTYPIDLKLAKLLLGD